MISVLYVDDERDLLEVAQLFLEESGEFNVGISTSAIEALESPSIRSYDAIISDYLMPGMDGIAFLKEVRERSGDVPFILFTGKGREEVVIEALNNGADFYIQKGGDPQAQFAELAHTIRQAVRRRKARLDRIQSETFDSNRRPAGVVGVMRDIPQQRQAEEALRESEERFRAVSEYSHNAICIVDEQAKITWANDQILAIGGYTRDQLYGAESFAAFIAPESIGFVLSNFKKFVAGEPYEHHYTFYFIRADGERRLCEKHMTDFADQRGKRNLVISMMDITERRKAEEALRESEEKYRSLVETSPGIIWEIDPEGRLRYISPIVATIMGYTPEELVGKPITDLIPEQRRSFMRQELSRHVSTEEPILHFEVPVRHRDGRDLVLEIRPSKIMSPDGNLIGFRGVANDTTRRKKSEEALSRANRQLTLLGSITSHDLLNKITVVRGYLKIAEKKCTDPLQSEYLGKMGSAIRAIQSQIEFTRLYQTLGTHEPQWIVLDAVMPRSQVPERIAMNADLKDIEIRADPMLERVFFNLLDNSIRHGKRVTDIRVSYHKSGDDMVLVWEDNGVGIPVEDKEQIFTRGFGENTGLGMFLVREILFLTGITIRETGEPGKGARFEIIVPKGAYQVITG